MAGAKLKLTAKTFLAAERRVPRLGNGVLQGILFQACIYLKRMFAALDEGGAERLFGTSLSFVRKIPPCAPPAVQAAMRAVEFVKSFAVLAHVQVARVALRAARGVEPLLVILENHEVEQAQQDAGASDSPCVAEKERDEAADQDGDHHDETDALYRFVGELAYAPHRTRNEDARYGRQETDREEQEIGFHGGYVRLSRSAWN